MGFRNLLKIAYRSLVKNKLRSFLTMLGIIIGVFAIVFLLGFIAGASSSIQGSISNLGTNVIMVFPGAPNNGGVRSAAGSGQNLIIEDVDAIRKFCPDIVAISPIVSSTAQTVYGSQNWHTSITGVSLDYFSVRNVNINKGNVFSPADEKASAKVCIVGNTVVDNLFGPGTNPVGKYIRVNKIPFRIIGVTEKKGQDAQGRDQDDVILAPFYTVQKRMLGIRSVNMVFASAASMAVMDKAVKEVNDLLLQRHKIEDPDNADFTIHTQAEISNTFNTITGVLALILGAVSTISLVVGGIGIMNIMLVSITERTREIGLRMAVGAKARVVLFQFLIEAVLLSLIGGLIGLVLAEFVGIIVSNLTDLTITITLSAVIFAFGSSSIIGIIAGFLPALKASRLRPIEALRYE